MPVTLVICVTYIVKHSVCVYNVNICNIATHFVNKLKIIYFFPKCVKCRGWEKNHVHS